MNLKELILQKDRAYRERDQLVAFLSHLVPAWISIHDENDKDWDPEWRYIIYMEIPSIVLKVFGDPINMLSDLKDRYGSEVVQLSWHIHESELPLFDHLQFREGHYWDGHTNEEKYHRMRNADFNSLGKLIRDVTNERTRK